MFVDIAYAQSAQSGGGGSPWFSQLFLFLPLILIFYFLIFRPQQKQRKEVQEMLSNLRSARAAKDPARPTFAAANKQAFCLAE